MNWQRLQDVHDAARAATVNYSMRYCEVDDSWSFSVTSAAPSEEWTGKGHSFDVAVDCVLELLNGRNK